MYQVDFNHPIHVYFIGIGGISMSGLAEILLSEGFTVSGSDWNRSALTEHLEKSGAHVNYGKPQKAENITDDIDLVVYTAAVHADNQEFSRAKELQLPMLSRAEFLGQLMKNYDTPIAVSGTHGKTTTTSMISEILLQANTDPTLSIGGILKSIHGNIRVGHSGLFVAEACEYTNSFLNFFPKIGIILNIEEDHLDFFKDLADIRASFRKFAQLLPADGTLFINGDIENWDWNLNLNDFVETYLLKDLKIIKNCKTQTGCWNAQNGIYNLNGTSVLEQMSGGYYKVQLSDGGYLAFLKQDNNHVHLYADTNGDKAPNRYGYDCIIMTMTKGSYQDYAHNITRSGLYFFGFGLDREHLLNAAEGCSKNKSGHYCGALFQYDGWKMQPDYKF